MEQKNSKIMGESKKQININITKLKAQFTQADFRLVKTCGFNNRTIYFVTSFI